ncbi:MAG TPA: hypothetical protein VGD43_06220 [Micromonospora sp.]
MDELATTTNLDRLVRTVTIRWLLPGEHGDLHPAGGAGRVVLVGR